MNDAGLLRWWTGHEFAAGYAAPNGGGFRGLRARPLHLAGIVLMLLALAAMTIGGLSVMGDAFPVPHAGVSSTADGLVIVGAACPGEHITEIVLEQPVDNAPSVELWHVVGDAPLPDQLLLGTAPEGMRTTVELTRSIPAHVRLSLRIVSNEVDGTVGFTPADVRFGSVETDDGSYPIDGFSKASHDDTPCGDPYQEKGRNDVLVVMALVAACLVIGSGALMVIDARRRTRARVSGTAASR